MEAYFALRERDLDLMLVKRVPQPQKNITFDVGHAVCWILDPKADQHIHSTVPKSGDMADRRRRGHHAFCPSRNFDGKFTYGVQIARVGDTKLHVKADQRAGV